MSSEKSVSNQLANKSQRSQKGPHLTVGRLRIDATTYGSTVVLIVGIIITAILQPVFLTVSNIANVLSQIAVLGILTMAQTIVLISGGIDLSVGSNVALSGVVAGLLFMHGVPLWIDCMVALLCATVIGLINGVLIAQNRAHPFIITLGMLTLLEGIAELVTGGSPVNDMGALATTLGGTIFFGIPTAVVLLFVVVVLTAFFLARTPLGRAAYAIGGNEEASYLSGIPIKRTKIYIYTLAGVIAGIAALTLSGILNAAEANIGTGLELQSIAAAVIGGTPLVGGRGGAWRSLQGVLLRGVISNSLNLMSVGANYQNIALGIIVLIAVMVQKNR